MRTSVIRHAAEVAVPDSRNSSAEAKIHGVNPEYLKALKDAIFTHFGVDIYAEGIKPETIIKRLADIIPRDPNEEALARGKAVVTA